MKYTTPLNLAFVALCGFATARPLPGAFVSFSHLLESDTTDEVIRVKYIDGEIDMTVRVSGDEGFVLFETIEEGSEDDRTCGDFIVDEPKYTTVHHSELTFTTLNEAEPTYTTFQAEPTFTTVGQNLGPGYHPEAELQGVFCVEQRAPNSACQRLPGGWCLRCSGPEPLRCCPPGSPDCELCCQYAQDRL